MKYSAELMSAKERFDFLFRTLSSESFLQKQDVGNEVPFFICSYPAKDAVAAEEDRRLLIQKLASVEIRIADINLYDLAVAILKNEGVWEQLLEIEPAVDKQELKENLQNMLDPAEYLAPAIEQRLEEDRYDIIFLSGVGEVYPYIRSHSVLNNLQTATKGLPLVLFFPGAYIQVANTGASLNLFEKFCSDKYYRAFDIFNY